MQMKGLILGFGNMGKIHTQMYQASGVHVSVVEIDKEKQREATLQHLEVYNSISDYLSKNTRPDFIDICLPTHLHFLALCEAMALFHDNPLPIMVEKPIVRHTHEAEKLNHLIKNYGAAIFVAEVEHYNPRINAFMKKNKNPASIEISRMVNLSHFLTSTDHWFLDPVLSGGLELDLMAHDYSILDCYFGEAKLKDGFFEKSTYKCSDTATVILEYPCGLQATVKGSWVSKSDNPIVLTIKAVAADGSCDTLIIDDYLRENIPNDENPFFLEIQKFLRIIQINEPSEHYYSEYLRVVVLANNIIELASQKLMRDSLRFHHPVKGDLVDDIPNQALLPPAVEGISM